MHDFQQRVIEEKAALDEKAVRLAEFIQSSTFEALPAAERLRLLRQHELMVAYSSVLDERIAAFGDDSAS